MKKFSIQTQWTFIFIYFILWKFFSKRIYKAKGRVTRPPGQRRHLPLPFSFVTLRPTSLWLVCSIVESDTQLLGLSPSWEEVETVLTPVKTADGKEGLADKCDKSADNPSDRLTVEIVAQVGRSIDFVGWLTRAIHPAGRHLRHLRCLLWVARRC